MLTKKMEKDELLKELGTRIRKLRRIRGLTQWELAELCGYQSQSSNSTINKIEAGKSDVPVSKLLKLSEVLGVSVAFLMGEGSDEEEEKYFAKNNAMMLLKKKLSADEQDELIKGLQIYFNESTPEAANRG